MTPEIMSVVLTGIGVTGTVLFGVWRIQSGYEARNERAHAEIARDVANLRERMAKLESAMETISAAMHGFMAGFRAKEAP